MGSKMTTKNTVEKHRALAAEIVSVALNDVYLDFILSRQAMRVSPTTLVYYENKLKPFILYLDAQAITSLDQVTVRQVRAFLALISERGYKDWTINGFARAIRTFLRFIHNENYTTNLIVFDMPKIRRERLPVLSATQVSDLITQAKPRDKAIILFMVDTGIRLAELIALRWDNLDLQTGRVRIQCGKGGKARTVVAGSQTRRALLAYRRSCIDKSDTASLWQTDEGSPLTRGGMVQVFHRLEKKTGIHFSAHALRRTFCILSLRAGMSPLVVQDLMGHADLTMTKHYAQMIDDDLVLAHKEFSPIDNLKRLK
jgi:site-specific recombinase XerD